jgi:hypothetical protein
MSARSISPVMMVCVPQRRQRLEQRALLSKLTITLLVLGQRRGDIVVPAEARGISHACGPAVVSAALFWLAPGSG